MYIIKSIEALRNFLKAKQNIGFVPTMGALHSGHIALIEQSKANNETTVCSIYINPTQFNNKTDFEKYPITLEKDIEMLCAAQCDVLFLPDTEEMYPDGTNKLVHYDIGMLDLVFDGKFRPGHFQGVCNIVYKLLAAVSPDRLYMGEKDFQQCMVIKRLLEITELPVELIICPTLREKSGLAKSSRNARLSEEGKVYAAEIFACLNFIKENFQKESFEQLSKQATERLSQHKIETEYLNLAEAETLTPMSQFNEQKKMVLLFAGFLEGVRLIDNIRIN